MECVHEPVCEVTSCESVVYADTTGKHHMCAVHSRMCVVWGLARGPLRLDGKNQTLYTLQSNELRCFEMGFICSCF